MSMEAAMWSPQAEIGDGGYALAKFGHILMTPGIMRQDGTNPETPRRKRSLRPTILVPIE